jgi:hypothetical protein
MTVADGSDADQEAILQLIADENAAYWRRDHAAWARCWVEASHIRRAGWWRYGGVTYREGWSEISARMRRFMEQNPVEGRLSTSVAPTSTFASDRTWRG